MEQPESNQIRKRNNNYVNWNIDKTDGLGRVHIRFSEQMNVNYSSKFINTTYLAINIKPYIGKYDQDEVARNLNISSWKVLEFVGNSLDLQISFESPLDISLNFIYDTLVV